MDLKNLIRFLKTSPLMIPVLALIDFILWLVDSLAITSTPVRQRPASLLIIRVDVLGDYLLFRNYLERIQQSTRYQGYTVTFCGNAAIKSVAELFDSDVIDRFIWVDIYKLSTRPLYRFQVVRQLRRAGCSDVFCPTFSRVLVLDDFLARASGAINRTGCLGDFVNIKRWEAWFGNRMYTRLLPSETSLVFEMERNRRVIESFLGESVPAMPPTLAIHRSTPVDIPTPCVILSLGAGQDFRVWPAGHFADVARFILKTYPAHHILLTGAPNERVYANAFLTHVPTSAHVLDLTGKLSIAQLIYILSKADLLIANETGVVHLAASTHTPTLVVSQGKSLVRWHPYPAGFGKAIEHLYPAFVEQHRDNLTAIGADFNPESPFRMTEISVARVIEAITRRLQPATV